MIVEKAAEKSDIPDIQEKFVGNDFVPQLSQFLLLHWNKMLQFSHMDLIYFQKFARETKEKSLSGHNEKRVCVFRPLE